MLLPQKRTASREIGIPGKFLISRRDSDRGIFTLYESCVGKRTHFTGSKENGVPEYRLRREMFNFPTRLRQRNISRCLSLSAKNGLPFY